MTLHRLEGHAAVAAALADAAAGPVERFTTDIRIDAHGVPVAVWLGDAAYSPPDAAGGEPADLDTPGPRHRLTMDPAGWRYERSEP
jgi:hypothetical protein